MARLFQKKEEDFICEQCGKSIQGNGFTNHCPFCLWSKHVDVNPGDREETCGGMMEPETVEMQDQKYVIVHRCVRCGTRKRNRVDKNDDMESVIKIAKTKNLENYNK